MELSTLESRHPSSAATLSARSPSSNKRTLDMTSSPTSRPASTSRGPACVPFWTASTGEVSRKLWSCTATDLRASPLISSSSYSANKAYNSWYTVKATTPPSQPSNSPKTLWQSQQSLWQVITANEQQKADADVSAREKKRRKEERSKAKKVYHLPRARKVRVYPDAEQKEQLRQWFGVVRRAYNTGVAVHRALERKDPVVTTRVKKLAFEPKRDKLGRPVIKRDRQHRVYILTRGWKAATKQVVREMEREDGLDYVLRVPRELRDSGIRDMEKAVDAGKAKATEKREAGDEVKREKFTFRSRRDKTQTMEVNSRDWCRNSAQARFFKAFKTKRERPPDQVTMAVRVQMDRVGRVFLCHVREVEAKGENQAPSTDRVFHSTAALDPGVRTFQTVYDADGQGFEWGKGDMDTIFRMCRQADKIQSKIARKKNGSKWGLRRAFQRVYNRIKDKVTECHRKLALFLVENYRVVLIPKFEVSRMAEHTAQRKIGSKTVRSMLTWGHFAFRQALKAKAELHPWCTVVECDEAYTSKTCEECGHLHQTLGSNKVFRCPSCGHAADRDLHAAKNILLRYLTREGLIPERQVATPRDPAFVP